MIYVLWRVSLLIVSRAAIIECLTISGSLIQFQTLLL